MLVLAKLSRERVGHEGVAYYVSEVPWEGGGVGVPDGASGYPGRWGPSSPSGLGLTGPVEHEALRDVLLGRRPGSSAPLGDPRHRASVAGWDLTVCAPKSISLLHALAPPEVASQVADAHGRAVDAASGYLVRSALGVCRERGGDRSLLPVDTVPMAAFVHRTSRALDPHLHTHVLLANVAHGPDGRWTALDGRGVYAHAVAAGLLYQAHLRFELTAHLGVAWGPMRSGRADLAGVDPVLRQAFSQRQRQIGEHLAERGLADRRSERSRRVAWAVTRPGKDAGRDWEGLTEWWRDRATDLGVEPERLVADVLSGRRFRDGPGVSGPEAPGAVAQGAVGHGAMGPATAGHGAPGHGGEHPRGISSVMGPSTATTPLADIDGGALVAGLHDVARTREALTRRDVVRVVCGALGEGAPVPAVEAVADGWLADASHGPAAGYAPPALGVREPRVPVRDLALVADGVGRHLEPGRDVAGPNRSVEGSPEWAPRRATGSGARREPERDRASRADRGMDMGFGR